MLLKFQILFYWCLSECVLSISWCLWFIYFIFPFLWLLCQTSPICLFRFILNHPLLLLSATNAWSIWNYFHGFLCVLVPSWFCPLGRSSRGMMVKRKTKVGCLFLRISSWGVDYAWLCPSMLLSVQLCPPSYSMCL